MKFTNFFEKLPEHLTEEEIASARKAVKNKALRLELAQLRERMGKTQSDVGSFSQASISRIESRSDIKLSTLIDYVHALGLELEISALEPGAHPKKRKILLHV